MALTLRQRANLDKGIALTEVVTFKEKIIQQIRRCAQDVLSGQLLPTTTGITGHGVTQGQLTEWAFRALRGSIDQLMVPMVFDDSGLPADPTTLTDDTAGDNVINAAVRRSIWPYAVQIGNGSF
jgi:hypothetical protein